MDFDSNDAEIAASKQYVRIVAPATYAGTIGFVKGHEDSGRCLIELEETILNYGKGPIVISLEKSEFEPIDSWHPEREM